VPRLEPDEVRAFLSEPGHLVRIATTDDGGMPLAVPASFLAESGRILVTPRERSVRRHCLHRDPRVCLLIDESRPPYRKVVVQGSAEVVYVLGEDDAWRDVYRAITLRYVPVEWGDAYLEHTRDERRELLAVSLDHSRSRVTTWRMPVAGEDPLAVWAPRYYHRG
jgi:nitroimidazol reductase NimA-like FMN-containing flavoprotein (pyridoxamine 5'-phosphate oxidase superfamily)